MDASPHDPSSLPTASLCSEEEAYAEHRAALEATLFRPGACEVVLVLENGALEKRHT